MAGGRHLDPVRRLGPALACACVVALVACGGGDPEQFAAELDALCVERSTAALEALEPIGGPRGTDDFDESLDQTEATLPALEDFAADLEELEPPSEREAAFDEYLELQERSQAAGRDAVESGSEGDEQGYGAALDEAGEARTDAFGPAEELGADACAAMLPDADEDEIRDIVASIIMMSEPSLCDEAFTDSYLERNFGEAAGDRIDDPREACVEFQDEANEAEGVSFEPIEGSGPQALIEVTPDGGQGDGTRFVVRVVRAEDGWRVNDIVTDG